MMGRTQDKPEGPPPKEEMHSIGTTKAKESSRRRVGDGLRLQVSIPKWAREAMNTSGGEQIWTRASSNGEEIEYVAELHGNGRTFVLPKDERQDLSLGVGDEVDFWVSEYDGEKDGSDKQTDEENEEGESEEEKPLIAIKDRAGLLYHVRDGDETVCGISLQNCSVKELTDPGDGLDACPQCNIKNPEDLSNEQIVGYLAEQAGFEVKEPNPSYLNKAQLVSLLEYVLELEED